MSKKHDKSDTQDDKPLVPRTAVSLQRMKLEKLMKNPVSLVNFTTLLSFLLIIINI